LARSIAAGWLCSFVLIQKNQKIKSADRLLCAQASALQTGQNHGLQLFCPTRAWPMLLQKLAMPLQPHKANIVLPAFARSLPADEEGKRFRTVRAKK